MLRHDGHEVMEHYLISKGMNPEDAEHVSMYSGAGVADWFKKHKNKILGTLGSAVAIGSAIGATALSNQYKSKQHEQQYLDALERGYDEQLMSGYGHTKFNLNHSIQDITSDNKFNVRGVICNNLIVSDSATIPKLNSRP